MNGDGQDMALRSGHPEGSPALEGVAGGLDVPGVALIDLGRGVQGDGVALRADDGNIHQVGVEGDGIVEQVVDLLVGIVALGGIGQLHVVLHGVIVRHGIGDVLVGHVGLPHRLGQLRGIQRLVVLQVLLLGAGVAVIAPQQDGGNAHHRNAHEHQQLPAQRKRSAGKATFCHRTSGSDGKLHGSAVTLYRYFNTGSRPWQERARRKTGFSRPDPPCGAFNKHYICAIWSNSPAETKIFA